MFATGPKYPSAPRFVQLLTLLIGVFVIGSCKDLPPTAPLRAPASVSFSSGADQNWVRSSFFFDATNPVPCLGEDVRVFGETRFQSHEVTSGSGNYNLHFFYPPVSPNTPQFFAQGVTSGKLFQYKNGGPITVTLHLAAGEVQTVHDKEVFVAADGSKLFFDFVMHVTINANGVVTVSRETEFTSLRCSRN
jgi:hypothetical protein